MKTNVKHQSILANSKSHCNIPRHAEPGLRCRRLCVAANVHCPLRENPIMASGVRILTLYSILSLAGLAILFCALRASCRRSKAPLLQHLLAVYQAFSLLLRSCRRSFRWGTGFGLVDSPNEKRKTHERATPLTGGIGFTLRLLQ